MLRHPARRYIAYLLSRRNRSAAEIVDHLDMLDIPIPREKSRLELFQKHIKDSAAVLRIPAGFNPQDKKPNELTAEFLDQYGIAEFWRRDPYVSAAVDLLFEPVLRRSLEAYLLSPLQPGHISTRLQDRYGVSDTAINPRVVRTYAHYFWDSMSMNHSEWRRFIDDFLGGAGHNEDLITCLMAPRTSAGVAMALAVVDRSVDSLTPVVVYSTMRDMAFRGFLESFLMLKPGLGKAHSTFMYFQTVKGAEDELARHRGATAAFLDEMQRIDAEYDQVRNIGIRDTVKLRGTNSTVVDTTGEAVEHGTK